jgi:hypothetical protein
MFFTVSYVLYPTQKVAIPTYRRGLQNTVFEEHHDLIRSFSVVFRVRKHVCGMRTQHTFAAHLIIMRVSNGIIVIHMERRVR